MVEVRAASVRVNGNAILDGVTVTFTPGSFNVIVGPNGAGKSTLLRVAAGVLMPSAGTVLYDSRPVGDIPATELARVRAVLSQRVELAFPLTVAEVVLIGRYAHYGAYPGRVDLSVVDAALETVGMSALRDREYSSLSGGEQQKVQLARVLAQIWPADAPGGTVLFLDEPTSGLDLRYQIQLLALTRSLLVRGCTVVAVLHDLNMALQFADTVVVMDSGRVVLCTERTDEVSESLIHRVFGVRAHRVFDPASGDSVWRFAAEGARGGLPGMAAQDQGQLRPDVPDVPDFG